MFDTAYQFAAKWEGGLSDVKADRGGITNYGISIVFLQDFAKRKADFVKSLGIKTPVTRETIINLKKEQAREIMREEFWNGLSLDDYQPDLAVAMFDCALNSGRYRSVRIAQEAHNYLRPDETPLATDGCAGPKTRAALAKYTPKFGLRHVWIRMHFLTDIASINPSQRVFLKGWLNRTRDLEKLLKTL